MSRPDFYKKRADGRFFCYLLFPIPCFLHTLLPSPRDTLELLGQILNLKVPVFTDQSVLTTQEIGNPAQYTPLEKRKRLVLPGPVAFQ